MREIKFRAWDRKKKQFDTCRNGGDILSFSLNYRGVSELSPKGYKVYQQYTGLKDKNGKEIYEGDIIEWFHAGDGFGGISSVEFGEYEDNEGYRVYKHTGWHIKDGFYTVVDLAPKAEVIGNIYENPELIGMSK